MSKYELENEIRLYNPETLVRVAMEYLKAENDACDFSKNHCMSDNDYLNQHEYHRQNVESAWSTFVEKCERVNANPIIVLSAVKSMNRYNRKHQASVKLPHGFNWNNHERYADTVCRYWSMNGFPEEKPAFPWSEI